MTSTSATAGMQTSRRTFLALCLATMGAAMLPLPLRLRALQAYAASAWPGFTPQQRAVLAAAADTVFPGGSVNARVGLVTIPPASQTGALDFITNLLNGTLLFAAGAQRPPYVKLPAGVSPKPFPAAGVIAVDGPPGTTHLWPVKRMGWFGDGPRPARPYSWPSQLDYLRQLYAAGIDDLNARAMSFGFASFDAMPAQGVPSRDSVLRQLHAQEAQAFDGKGEDHQPFFLTLLDHLTEACFGDPVYGGNKGWVYWKAIGFTGPAYVAASGPAPGNGWTPRDMTQQFDPTRTWADWTIT